MMKQNMKKSIIMTIIYCMGIGGLTLFIGALYPGKNVDGVAEAINREKELVIVSDNSNNDRDYVDISKSALASTTSATPIPTPEATATPGPTPIPTPLPVYELSVGGYPEIEQFFHDYYVAWNSCDYNLLKTKATNPDNITPLIDIEKETQFIDDIRDNMYYIMKSYEDDTYIVYAYYEIKYVNIKTTLPRLDKFYLVKDEDGNLIIYNSEMDDILKTYFDERDNDDLVSWIIEGTNDKANTALKNDENLRVYVEALYRK
ncbi:MAG: hypothetical protein GX129_00455 [Clostridiales bacterium]|jgi:hypothetical protein|nr:hypothetical protein [Clostridiales bacterium]